MLQPLWALCVCSGRPSKPTSIFYEGRESRWSRVSSFYCTGIWLRVHNAFQSTLRLILGKPLKMSQGHRFISNNQCHVFKSKQCQFTARSFRSKCFNFEVDHHFVTVNESQLICWLWKTSLTPTWLLSLLMWAARDKSVVIVPLDTSFSTQCCFWQSFLQTLAQTKATRSPLGRHVSSPKL